MEKIVRTFIFDMRKVGMELVYISFGIIIFSGARDVDIFSANNVTVQCSEYIKIQMLTIAIFLI